MKKFLKVFAILFFVGLIFAIAAFSVIINTDLIIKKENFSKEKLIELNAKISLYDKDEEFLGLSNIKTPQVKLKDLPTYVPQAFISIEDKDFLKHKGLNLKRMLKAVVTNLTKGYAKEGASTISQQLIKNTHLNSEKTINRKLNEILLTLRLEKEFNKEDILETYLNVIYFGAGSYGIESAAWVYFDKSAKDLSLEEAAMLAAIIKAPRTYSPLYDKEVALIRRNVVLEEMFKDKKITRLEKDLAKATPINITNKKSASNFKQIYEKAALAEVGEILNLSEKDVAISGLKIFTYMDKNLQQEIKTLAHEGSYYEKNAHGNTADSAIVVIDNKTGAIEAFYGSSPYDILNMHRPPGSAIKPILVYAPALEEGKISPVTPLLDESINIHGYQPTNVGDRLYGWISARASIEKSLNIPAIKIMQYVGIEKAKEFAKQAGIKFSEEDLGYSIALGGFNKGSTLIELTNSYLPFSQEGNFVKASFIKRIENPQGKVLYKNKASPQKIMSEETAYLMTDMLISSVKNGTSKKLSTLNFEVAGKTGTVGLSHSPNNSDAWSIAYTKEKTAGVWMGNSSGEVSHQLLPSNNGGTYASLLLREVLKNANKGKNLSFSPPKGIVKEKIDLIQLQENHRVMLASENLPEMYTLSEVFNKKYVPKDVGNTFESLAKPVITVKTEENAATISFEAKPYIVYELYKTQEDQTTLLSQTKHKSGKVEFLDKNLEEDYVYTYHLVAKQINNITGKTINLEKSEEIKIVINTPSPSSGAIKKPSRARRIIKWLGF